MEKLQALTAPDADLEYSILRGKLDADDVRAICEGLRIAIDTLRTTQAKPCADCGQVLEPWEVRICEPCQIPKNSAEYR